MICAAACMLIFLAAFQFILPSPFHNDFRHIFPLLVPLCLLYAKVVERLRCLSTVLYKFGIVIAVLMIASSVAFFVRAL